jgi:ribosome-binding protein aMBF1 (putative translation factor)
MRPSEHSLGGTTARPVCEDNQASSVIRTFEYLMAKYAPPPAPEPRHRIRIPKTAKTPRKRRNVLTKDEHDSIFRAYHSGCMSQKDLCKRYGRSPSLICSIVNKYHPLFTHDKKTA